MTNFSQMQQRYIENRAAGMTKKASAEGAGYSPATAERQAFAMERREDIKNAIAKAKRDAKKSGVNVPEDEDAVDVKYKMPKAKYDDAKEFLLDAMNHPRIPLAARAEYAKALLPYQHARIAEKGKKDSLKDEARAIANGGKSDTPTGRGKFQKKAPPREARVSTH